jgi:uncharacterized protein YndB with AHSA1/START domain
MTRAMCAALLAILAVVVHGQTVADAPTFVNEATLPAPIVDVWRVWSTSEGYKAVGVALADVDLRVGGLIRSRYAADGVLGDAQTIENEILAYEPPRMIAFRIHKTPANFPFKDAWKRTWTVVTLTPVDAGHTHLRAASLGFGSDPESVSMRQFFERGNQQTMDSLTAYFSRGARH